MNEQEKLSKILYYSDMHPDNCQFIQDLIDNKDKEIEKLNNIINEFDEWLKEKKEQMEEFELYKRKETGAFWYSTMGNIETFIGKIKELKGSEKK